MPDILDLASRPVTGGYFLRRRSGVPDPFVGAADGDTTHHYAHCFTYWTSERTIRRAALDLIAGARRKIFVASFLLGDDEMHDALVAAAQRLLGGVYVITQVDGKRLRQGLAELGQDPGTALQSQKKRFDRMTTQGIYVRGHANCHAKFLVVDDERALVTSANLMTDAFDRTGENGVVVTDRTEVERLARLFARLWHRRCQREAIAGDSYTLKKVSRDASAAEWSATVPAPALDGRPEIIWTDSDDGERHILTTIQHLLDDARRDVLLATFSLVGMRENHSLLLDRVAGAVERGARVRLLIRPRRNRADHVDDAAALARAGVEVYADTETHMKGVIADDERGALFSANFDSQHGLTDGVEVGVRLDGTTALAEVRRLFLHAIDQASLRLVADPTHQTLAEGLDATWHTPWPLGRQVPVAAAAEHRSRFVQATSTGPVLFSTAPDGALLLHAGRTHWHLTAASEPDRPPDLDRLHRLRPANPRRNGGDGENGRDSHQLLATWLTTPDGAKRGLCATTIDWQPHDG
jgi:phosphatidylserine/phosphatidylglycerophosphate/cardiolipin synthase-like enzyme